MIHQRQNPALDRSKLEKLGRKEYRDAYLRSQVHNWIAYQFQSLRKKFGLTQSEMSKRTGKPQSVISRLENEDYRGVSVQTLLDFACAMDVALVVQFVSYPDFLLRMRDKSEASMQPRTISESISHQERENFMHTQRSLSYLSDLHTSKNISAFAANEHSAKQTARIQPMSPSRDTTKTLIGIRT